MSLNKVRYSITLDTCQSIKDNPQRGEILTTKEHIK